MWSGNEASLILQLYVSFAVVNMTYTFQVCIVCRSKYDVNYTVQVSNYRRFKSKFISDEVFFKSAAETLVNTVDSIFR